LNIQVNGEPQEIDGPLTISTLLARLNIEPRRVAVEHNLAVIKRHLYDATVIEDGDTIEIVNLVGGGAGRAV
jgi:thiamine biosynthesis protein ThiS